MNRYNPHFRAGQPVRYSAPDLAGMLAYMQAGLAKCAQGEHQPTTVPANRVVYAGYGRRRQTGDRYCNRCDTDLPPAEGGMEQA